MFLTYRYRLIPTRAQHRALERILEDQRLLYNAALEERIDAYHKAGVTRTYFDQCKALTEWRRGDPDAAAVAANLQRWTLKRLDDAYQAFFRRVNRREAPGFPRFRGVGRFVTFGFAQFLGIRFINDRVRFKGMTGAIRVHVHRQLPESGLIRSCFFRRDVKGWQIGFSIELPDKPLRRGIRAVGVDLGINTFAALSDGGFIPSLRAARRAQRRIRVSQRALARKLKGSRGRLKARIVLGRRHAAVSRARANYLHQGSARLIRDYDSIAVEKLDVRALSRGILAKDVCDASWARFISMLRYKAECAGSRLIEVDPVDTSQDCSGCGARIGKKWGDRVHECPCCGLRIDRDLNAARNILGRAGMGPGLPNVADVGMRAGGNLGAVTAR